MQRSLLADSWPGCAWRSNLSAETNGRTNASINRTAIIVAIIATFKRFEGVFEQVCRRQRETVNFLLNTFRTRCRVSRVKSRVRIGQSSAKDPTPKSWQPERILSDPMCDQKLLVTSHPSTTSQYVSEKCPMSTTLFGRRERSHRSGRVGSPFSLL